jgi:hypothetical protein
VQDALLSLLTLSQDTEETLTTQARAIPLEHIAATLPRLPENLQILTIIDILPPDTPAPRRPATPALQQIAQIPVLEGTVESFTREGMPVIRTDTGRFVLKTAAEIPLNSTVRFAAVPATPERLLAALPARMTDPAEIDPRTDRTWPALAETLQSLRATPAAQNMHNTLPAPAAARFTPAALFFLAALRMGDIENWLGKDTLDAIKRKTLIERLTSDFSRISEQSKETLPGGWKMISMPLMHDEQVSQMHFYVRRQQEEGGGKAGAEKPATRFILNLSLSRLGDMQIDGYIRKKQFDAILRSDQPFSPSAQRDLMRNFSAAMEQTRMQGTLKFQTRKEGWVDILPDGTGVTA